MADARLELQLGDICGGCVTRSLASPGFRSFVSLGRVEWIKAVDLGLFRWINRDLGHPVADAVMSFLSGNPVFFPALGVVAILLVVRGGPRGVVCVLMMGLAAGLANEFVVEPLKDGIQRLRPYAGIEDVVLRVGRGNPRGSMPSAHALNMALLATVAVYYYRRAVWSVVPIAFGVGFSRVYNGVHYPSDVLAGWVLGVASALVTIGMARVLWHRWAPRWVPRAWRRIRDLAQPPREWAVAEAGERPPAPRDSARDE